MNLDHAGVRLALPTGWEARARLQPSNVPGRRGNLLLHAATIPLPAERGDFGSGVVEHLGPEDVFVSLFEYDAADAGKALFATKGLPVLRPSDFSTAHLQRTQLGRSGGQWFFQVAGRPFCLFVVLGSHSRRAAGAARATALLLRTTVKELA
ncbi:MAG: hypothetical protein JWM62_454 [Frankiales bacterium]|nr:hypothetical protein [Frankiales bacterium]